MTLFHDGESQLQLNQNQSRKKFRWFRISVGFALQILKRNFISSAWLIQKVRFISRRQRAVFLLTIFWLFRWNIYLATRIVNCFSMSRSLFSNGPQKREKRSFFGNLLIHLPIYGVICLKCLISLTIADSFLLAHFLAHFLLTSKSNEIFERALQENIFTKRELFAPSETNRYFLADFPAQNSQLFSKKIGSRFLEILAGERSSRWRDNILEKGEEEKIALQFAREWLNLFWSESK